MCFAPRWGGTSIKKSQKEDTGKKSQDVLFSENRFCSLSVWDLLCPTRWVFWSEILTRHPSLCLLSFGWYLSPDSSHKIRNKFFIHHCSGWKEGSFVCETVWFFSWVNTHPFDLKSIAFCPKLSGDSYVEFQEKTIASGFFINFCKPRLPTSKTCEISPYLLQYISGSVLRWKRSQKYFRMLFAPRWGGTSINKSQKEDTGKKSQDVLFSENRFCSLSVWDVLRSTPWVFSSEILTRHPSLCLLSFGWDLSSRLVPQDLQ